jgi:hypothetical protein
MGLAVVVVSVSLPVPVPVPASKTSRPLLLIAVDAVLAELLLLADVDEGAGGTYASCEPAEPLLDDRNRSAVETRSPYMEDEDEPWAGPSAYVPARSSACEAEADNGASASADAPLGSYTILISPISRSPQGLLARLAASSSSSLR